MSYQAKVTSKGQITLPAEMRQALGIKPGDHIRFEKSENGDFRLKAKTHTFDDLRGLLSGCKWPSKFEDMQKEREKAHNALGDKIMKNLREAGIEIDPDKIS